MSHELVHRFLFFFVNDWLSHDAINYIITFFVYHYHRQLMVFFKIIEGVLQLNGNLFELRVILAKMVQVIHAPFYVVSNRENMHGNKILPGILCMCSKNIQLVNLIIANGNAAHPYATTVNVN